MSSETSKNLALEVTGVSHAFGARLALDHVSLSVPRGRFCALLGQNGAGKTTLFSLITRLYDNTSGVINVFDYDIRRKPAQALQQLGVVFQSRTVDPELSVMQNLIYHASLHGMSRQHARGRGLIELERIALAERADDKVRNLSGGQIRRVEIARALMHQPNLLLLDEPTIGLDIGSRQDLVSHVRRLISEDQLAVLWATHLIDEVGEEDDVVILHEGKVCAAGLVRDVIENTKTDSLRDAFNFITNSSAGEAG